MLCQHVLAGLGDALEALAVAGKMSTPTLSSSMMALDTPAGRYPPALAGSVRLRLRQLLDEAELVSSYLMKAKDFASLCSCV